MQQLLLKQLMPPCETAKDEEEADYGKQ